MVISVSNFINKDKKHDIDFFFSVREIALSALYNVPEYKAATLETKNYLYDAVRNRLFAIGE